MDTDIFTYFSDENNWCEVSKTVPEEQLAKMKQNLLTERATFLRQKQKQIKEIKKIKEKLNGSIKCYEDKLREIKLYELTLKLYESMLKIREKKLEKKETKFSSLEDS